MFHSAAIIVCVVGVIIILVAVLGCFAAWREFYLGLIAVRVITTSSLSLLTYHMVSYRIGIEEAGKFPNVSIVNVD